MMSGKTIELLQDELLAAIRNFAREWGDSAVHGLAGPLFEDDLERIDVSPRHHLAINSLAEMEDMLLPEAKLLFQALLDAAPVLAWQNSYSIEDGFGQEYLNKYAWCDIIGPQGIYFSDQVRIGFGYWRKGLFYPSHSHEPEEIYWVIGGSGLFSKGDESAQHRGPGSVVHHQPYVWHSIDMTESPVLVVFLWKGANLHLKSSF
jgi:hypothetical protein